MPQYESKRNVVRHQPLLLAFLALALMAVEWILFVASIHLHEMIVGAMSASAAATFLFVVRRSEKLVLSFTLQDLATCWRIPWYLLSGTYEITALLFKDLFGISKTGSYYRVSAFKADETNQRIIARSVLAIVYTTVAPNFIVVGIDSKQHRMLFHQLERSRVPEMTKNLGAEG